MLNDCISCFCKLLYNVILWGGGVTIVGRVAVHMHVQYSLMFSHFPYTLLYC